MLLTTILLASGVIIFFAFYLPRMKGKAKGKPLPGPPVLESLQVFLKGAVKNTLRFDVERYADKYGHIMQFRLLIMNVVFVNDADTFRRICAEPLVSKYANDKPPTFLYRYFNYESLALENNTPKHAYKRKIFQSLLKFYGEGVGKLESLIAETLQDLSEVLRKTSEVEVRETFRDYISSIIVVLMTGAKSSHTKNGVKRIKNWSRSVHNLFMFENNMCLQIFPFLRHISCLRFKALCEEASRGRKEFVETFINPAKTSQDNDRTFHKGIVYELLDEREKPESKFEITDNDIEGLLLDVIGGAYLTMSGSISSIVLQLAKNPEIQQKIYDETIRVTGDATPSINHRKDMHYTEAVILETLRYITPFPFFFRGIREDIEFDGYHIPGGSTLLANAWYNNHITFFGDDPWVFKPERFLDENGQLLDLTHPIRQKSLTFGSGPRKCPGEVFAKSRIFLTVTTLVKQFEILPSEAKELTSSDPRDWENLFALQPGPFNCRFVPRDSQ